jgi:hypothetical protein
MRASVAQAANTDNDFGQGGSGLPQGRLLIPGYVHAPGG